MDINVGKGAIKKGKNKKFKASWLNEDNFKGWLAHSGNNAICTVCNKIIRCCKRNLIKHSQTDKHIENVNSRKAIEDIDNTNTSMKLSHEDKVKRAEIKLATFFAMHDVDFDAADHLVKLLQDICKDSEIAQNVALNRSDECTNIIDNANNKSTELSHEDVIKRAASRFAAFFDEYDFDSCAAEHLMKLLQNLFKDCEVPQDVALNRAECTNIIKDAPEVIPKREDEKIAHCNFNAQSSRFSILIDENSDNSGIKEICILFRYLSSLNKKVATELFELICSDARDYSACKLFEAFKSILEELEIPIKNIVGIACDNFNEPAMIEYDSFVQHLKLEVPGLVTLNCTCHSVTLIVSKACEKLPLSCENLIRNVSTYISDSVKKCRVLGEFQEFVNVERNKLKSLNIRWLVSQKCVYRILENWEDLKNYFITAVAEDKSKSAEIILSQFNDDTIKAYFLFLKFALLYFNGFNALFESQKILLHKLHESSQRFIRQLTMNFMTINAREDINYLDMNNVQNIKNVEDIFVGPECENLLGSLSLESRQEIKLACLNFYKTAVQEMLKRLPYNDPLFEYLTFLEPKIALYNNKGRNTIKDLTYIATTVHIEHIDISQLAVEWDILPSVFDERQKQELASLNIDEMWNKIVEYKNCNQERLFPNLELLVEVVLSFPHSNAETKEIFFSILTDEKNERN